MAAPEDGENQPPAPLDLNAIAISIRNCTDIFDSDGVTRSIRTINGLSLKNTKAADREVTRFFHCLERHPEFFIRQLALFGVDELGTPTRQFYLLMSGTKSTAKKEIINTCLILYARCMRMSTAPEDVDWESLPISEQAKYELQPSTVTTRYKLLFASFGRAGVAFQQKDFDMSPGSYKSYWANRMQAVAKERID